MSKVTFNTTSYENSHGRKPRGAGNWMFASEVNPVWARNSDEEGWRTGNVLRNGNTLSVRANTYQEAKQRASAVAYALGWDQLHVMP